MGKKVTGYGVPKKFGQEGSYSTSTDEKKDTPPKPTNLPEQVKIWLDGLNSDNDKK